MFAASVSLTTSAMTNITSHRRLIPNTLRFPLVSQRLFSSSISQCTNYLYGTGLLDLNLGSALCCLNSSFSKCKADTIPTEDPPKMYLQHITTHFDQKLSPTFTQFDTCTFRDISADRGGAIDSDESGASLSITKCSFLRCNVDSDGGSLYFWPSSSPNSFAVSHSSFASSKGTRGGGIYVSYCEQTSITDCEFYNGSAGNYGGSLYLRECPGLISQLSLDGWERFENTLHLVFFGTGLQEKEGYLARLQIKQSGALDPLLFTFPIQVLNDTAIAIPFDKDIPRASLYTVESFSFLKNPEAQPESIALSSSTFYYPQQFTVLSVDNELGPLAFLVAPRDSRFTFALTLKSSEGAILTSSSCRIREGELYFMFDLPSDQIPSGYYVTERVLTTKDGTTESHFIDAYGVQLPLPAVTSIECIPAIRGHFFLVLHGSHFPIDDPSSYVMFKMLDEHINCSIKHETQVVGLSQPWYGSQPYSHGQK
ncbi:hypothetical protein BLNAU_19914 [Blattamonas nauphoetae]|uniref:Uncharacterized protein n=1 Tax=Blattamonas nauphoetae TaxID=2049346 RepID=A0ABQ9X4E0_9EUKA|nr:hypothetical protein BLNAU_19914 [Blattamonas nauphoetae]